MLVPTNFISHPVSKFISRIDSIIADNPPPDYNIKYSIGFIRYQSFWYECLAHFLGFHRSNSFLNISYLTFICFLFQYLISFLYKMLTISYKGKKNCKGCCSGPWDGPCCRSWHCDTNPCSTSWSCRPGSWCRCTSTSKYDAPTRFVINLFSIFFSNP